MPIEQPKVSVVIPAYNEATYIDRLLEALSKQDFDSFEVIVSDAESKDGTKEVVEDFKKSLDVKFVTAPPLGPSHGRNVGANKASGEWLLFLDADDDIDDPRFIDTLVSTAEKKAWNTASAKMRVRGSIFTLSLLYRYQKLLAHTKHPVAQGWCILTKKSVFDEAKGFNEKIHFGEDNDYVSRVGRHGFGFVDSTTYYVDLRRNKHEGFGLIIKGIKNEWYRHTHGYDLENNPNEYKFGHHPKREK